MNAEFFDIFGIIGLSILLLSGIKVLKSENKTNKKIWSNNPDYLCVRFNY